MKTETWQWPVAYWGGVGGGFNPPPPPKFRRPSKIVPNSIRLWKLLKIAEFRMPTPQDVRKKGSKILKLPPVRSCFVLAMTSKLVVIINSLKVPKIKKLLLYEMKFLVPNYSCLQNPWLGGHHPQTPFSLSSVLKWICWTPPRTKFLGKPLTMTTTSVCVCEWVKERENKYRICLKLTEAITSKWNYVYLNSTSVSLNTIQIVGWRERNQQPTNLMFIIRLLPQHVSGIIMLIFKIKDCALPHLWCSALDVLAVVVWKWDVSCVHCVKVLHPTFMMRGHKSLKFTIQIVGS